MVAAGRLGGPAFPRLTEAFQIFSRLQQPHGIAVAGSALGQLLIAADRIEQGRQVLTASLAAATKIGWTELVQQISDLLDQPPQ